MNAPPMNAPPKSIDTAPSHSPSAPPRAPTEAQPGQLRLIQGDNLPVLTELPDSSLDLIYIDPPFNTGKKMTRRHMRFERDEAAGKRKGFGGKSYRLASVTRLSYEDKFEDLPGYLRPRVQHMRRLLKPHGSLFVHLDSREVHYVKVMLDEVFGRASFMNEIIWAYDYGARTKTRWPAKHDHILWYAKDPKNYTFNYHAMDRMPYMAPKLVTPEKAARGKTPTDVWWHTIVPTSGHEKTGYPTQKPQGILRRIVAVHSNPGDQLADFFAGSGSFGQAASTLGRHCLLVDAHPDACRIMKKRLGL